MLARVVRFKHNNRNKKGMVMALVKCKECGVEISEKADKCPQCGSPSQKKSSGFGAFAVLVLLFAIGFSLMSPSADDDASEIYANLDRSSGMQKDRKKLIDKLIDRGIFKEATARTGTPKVVVKPAFYSLDYDDKKLFTEVVFTYYLARGKKNSTLLISDYKTGKNIGSFSSLGLDLD